MDAFKAAFHESSEDAAKMEEEKKREEEEEEAAGKKKKKKKGGMFNFAGLKEGVSKRYSMAKKMAKRAVTPPKDGIFNRSGKVRVCVEERMKRRK